MNDLFVIAPLNAEMRKALEAHFNIHHVDDMDDPIRWLARHGAGIEYALTDGHYGIRPDFMAGLPNLKLVSSNGVGYDAIDTGAAVSRGILVTHTPAVLSAEVATTALMLLIACYRDFRANVDLATSGKWAVDGNLALARSVDNRTIGILGLGRIGQAIADKLAPFQPRILYNSRSPKAVDYTYYDDLTAMARDAEVLICIAPGGAETHHLVNAKVLEALGPDGVLINVGRGSVVDENALIAALSDGRLGAAGLDVFEDEPNIPDALRAMPNVVLTPHIGSATVETRAAMAQLAIDNLLQHRKDGTVITPVPECAELL
ncbi:2-hydroxyacid dehydrogenase [Yoonia sp. SS1-5]|uniref:2-hydroxyacid dehydrogenase n=1 Tax=Yoonia rhodophyticola TaxID=3137370 RepID=A0AAN0NM13_9RHOB